MTREETILSLTTLVEVLVHNTVKHLPRHVKREDLYAYAWMGAIEAVDRHDPRKATLQTYANRLISGRLRDELRRLDPLTRDHRKLVKNGTDPGVAILGLERDQWNTLRAQKDRAPEIFETSHDLFKVMKRTRLTKRHRYVLEHYYWHEETDLEIGEKIGLKESRTCQVRNEAIAQLRNTLNLPQRPVKPRKPNTKVRIAVATTKV